MENSNDIKTRLMTLLNVSHLRATKRTYDLPTLPDVTEPSQQRVKLNQRRIEVAEPLPNLNDDATAPVPENVEQNSAALMTMMTPVKLYVCYSQTLANNGARQKMQWMK